MQYIKHFVRFLYALFTIENTSPYARLPGLPGIPCQVLSFPFLIKACIVKYSTEKASRLLVEQDSNL